LPFLFLLIFQLKYRIYQPGLDQRFVPLKVMDIDRQGLSILLVPIFVIVLIQKWQHFGRQLMSLFVTNAKFHFIKHYLVKSSEFSNF